MMRRLLALMIVMLLSAGVLFSQQEASQRDAKLVYRCEKACSSHDSIMERTLDLTHNGEVTAETVVVRVCSKEPMPAALSVAAMNPFKVARWLNDTYNYPPERVVFLRSEDCLGSNAKVAATELWAVPKGAALPTSVESVRASQVRSEPVGKQDLSAEGARSYRTAVQELTAQLNAKPDATGVVLGYYYKKPSPVMERRLREVRKLLEQSGLPQDRYCVRLAAWTGERSVDPPDPEPKYPSLFVVKVAKAKDSVRE